MLTWSVWYICSFNRFASLFTIAPKRDISRSGNGFMDAESMDDESRGTRFRSGGVWVFVGNCLLGLVHIS